MEFAQQGREKSFVINLEDDEFSQQDATKRNANTAIKSCHLSNHKLSSHLDLTMNSLGHPSDTILPGHQNHGTGNKNLISPINQLPVLGLCAPNANQLDLLHKSASRSKGQQSKPVPGPEFPFSLPPCSETSIEMDIKHQETTSDKLKLLDASAENLQPRLKNNFSDGWHLFSQVFYLIVHHLCQLLNRILCMHVIALLHFFFLFYLLQCSIYFTITCAVSTDTTREGF